MPHKAYVLLEAASLAFSSRVNRQSARAYNAQRRPEARRSARAGVCMNFTILRFEQRIPCLDQAARGVNNCPCAGLGFASVILFAQNSGHLSRSTISPQAVFGGRCKPVLPFSRVVLRVSVASSCSDWRLSVVAQAGFCASA